VDKIKLGTYYYSIPLKITEYHVTAVT